MGWYYMTSQFQIYTGDGKGKTTCAIGLAIRTAGWKKKVAFVQLLKNKDCGEDKIISRIRNISHKKFGCCNFIIGKPNTDDKKEIKLAMDYIWQLLNSKKHIDLVIIDEINVAIYFRLISLAQAKDIIAACRCKNIDLVFTGRKAKEEIINLADLVTEMKPIKHYYNKGVPARKGIEY
jgi:cob(I)alamin adenosyltransferase